MVIPNVKIVADSSADTLTLEGIAFKSVPLKIITAQREYVDDADLDVAEMADDLAHYSGRSSSACPSPGEWLEAFGDAKYVFCVAITGTLSGSYNAACIAKKEYEERFPDRKVFVLDSLSTGPELRLIIEQLRESILRGDSFEEICATVTEYTKRTALLFVLESMKNLANNGRVSPFVAKAAGLLGIRVVGKASDQGDLEPLEKCRGEKKALAAVVQIMKQMGHSGGKVRISHCLNETAARTLKELIQKEFQNSQLEIYPSRGLCTYYAERGGLLIGFEKQRA